MQQVVHPTDTPKSPGTHISSSGWNKGTKRTWHRGAASSPMAPLPPGCSAKFLLFSKTISFFTPRFNAGTPPDAQGLGTVVLSQPSSFQNPVLASGPVPVPGQPQLPAPAAGRGASSCSAQPQKVIDSCTVWKDSTFPNYLTSFLIISGV